MSEPSNILIVEDDAVLVLDLQTSLSRLGYQCCGAAATGQQAVELALSQQPDVILMDIHLRGEMNGIQAATEIHQQQDTPIIYLTAYTDETLLQQAKTTDAYAYLAKPVRERELRASLEMAIYKHATGQRLQHLNQVLRAVRDVNQLITRERDPQLLQNEACRVLLNTRGYLHVWIGHSDEGLLTPIASLGQGQQLLQQILADASPEQRQTLPGPQAALTRLPVLCADMLSDDRFAPWRAAVENSLLRSSLAVPITHANRLFGVLVVYAGRINNFDQEESDLLIELANDIAFGLNSIDEETRKRETEQALRRSEAKFRAVVENSTDGFTFCDADGFSTYRSPTTEQVTQFTNSERIGRSVFEMVHPDDLPNINATWQHSLATPGLAYTVIFRVRNKLTGWTWVEANIQNRLEDPDVGEMIITSRDITARKQAEQALNQSELRYRAISEDALVGVYIIQEGVFTYVNPALAHIFNYSREELVGKSPFLIIHPDDQALVGENINARLNGETHSVQYEFRGLRKDGEIRCLRVMGVRTEIEDQPAIIGNLIDITENKQAEQALQASERRFRALFEQSQVAITLSREGKGLYANPRFLQLFGLKELDEFVGRPILDFFAPQFQSNLQERTSRRAQGLPVPPEFDSLGLHSSGGQIPVHVAVSQVELADGPANMAYVTDISLRKVAEEQILKLGLGIEHSNDAIFLTDTMGVITYTNQAFEKIYGYSPAETLGKTPRILKSSLLSLQTYQSFWARLLNKQPVIWEITNRTRDGKLINIESSNNPILDEHGQILGFLGVQRDITERKLAEEAIRQRNRELTTLNQIGQALNKQVEPAEILELIHSMVGQLMDNKNMFIALHHPTTQSISFPVYKLDGDLRNGGARPLRNGITDYVIRTRQPFMVKKDLQSELQSRGIELIGTLSRSFLAVPMQTEDEVLGVIALQDYEHDNAYDQHHLEILATIAAQASIALVNARLFHAVQRELEERKRAEEALLISEKNYRLLFENAPVGILGIDQQGRILDVNPAALNILGSPSAEATRQINFLTYPTLIEVGAADAARRCLQNGETISFDTSYTSKWGRTTYLQYRMNPIYNEAGQIELAQLILEDITERKRSETLVRMRLELVEFSYTQSIEQVLQKTLDQVGELTGSPIGYYCLVSADQQTISLQTWSTRSLREYSQLQEGPQAIPSQQAGAWAECVKSHEAIIHNNLANPAVQPGDPSGQTSIQRELAVPIVRGAQVVAVLGLGNKASDYDAKDMDLVSYFADMAWEIAERKRAESERESLLVQVTAARDETSQAKDTMVGVMERVSDGIVALDKDFNYTYVNTYGGELLGRSATYLVGKNYWTEYPESRETPFAKAYVEAMQTQLPRFFEAYYSHWQRWFTNRVYPSAEGITIFFSDITERKNAEIALRESEEKFAAAFNDAPVLICINDMQTGLYLDVNAEGLRISGFSREEVIGHHPVDLGWISKDEFERLVFELQTRGLIDNTEMNFRTRQGTRLTGLVKGDIIRIAGRDCLLTVTMDITERKVHERELQAIATLSAALRTAPTRDEMFPVIVDQMVNLLNVDAAVIEIVEPESHDTLVEAAYGSWANLVGERQAPNSGLNGLINQTNQPFLSQDLTNDSRLSQAANWPYAGLLGCAGLALTAQETLVGYLWIGCRTRINEKELQIFIAIGDIVANAIHRATLHDTAITAARDLVTAYDSTLLGWARALELRDQETEGHSQRVVGLTIELARHFNLPAEELVHIRHGAILHDIGKMGVPDSILHKAGPLSEAEWAIMRRHPVNAYNLLAPIEHLRPALSIPYCHHEKWDGSGYPRGLHGEQIPLAARLFSVVDVWDALRSQRPYRESWSLERTIEYIRAQAGHQFDPRVVEAFLSLIDEA
jgi:PAS domain S-box-containing protein